jgi:hypothetical protein
MKALWKKVVSAVLLSVVIGAGWAWAQQAPPKPGGSPEQQKRMELMKSRGPEASLTILPIRLPGSSVGRDFQDRVSEAVGWILEQQGLKSIELGRTDFDPGDKSSVEHMAVSLGDFVRKNPITTEYALYAEYRVDPKKHAINELRAAVVDKTGAVVWTDRLTPQDEVFRKVGDPDAMGFSVLLVERLSPQLSLNEETAKAAKPGRMAQLMDERSALPPENERAPLPERLKVMKGLRPKATLVIFPVRIGGQALDAESATTLAKMINDGGLCKAAPAQQSLLLKASLADPNELKALWGLAREFRDYAKKNPTDDHYVLYADYVFTPGNWEQGFVHFVVCDPKGEWVIADLQNSHQPDYQSVKPTSKEDCDRLLVKRLERYLRAGTSK